MTAFVHLVVRADQLPVPLVHDDVAPRLWERLEHAFPTAIAAVLMPNHLHLLAELGLLDGLSTAGAAEAARVRLGTVVRALGREVGGRRPLHFEPIPPVLPDDDPIKLLRQARYIALNPVRAKLVRDPLAWTWSTLRDVVGAVARPWVTAEHLARAVERPVDGFTTWFHRYVARDDDVDPAARAFPKPAVPAGLPELPLAFVERAAVVAVRRPPTAIQRRGDARALFVALASQVGWGRSDLLAARCGVTARAVRKALHRATPAALEAALLCLGDERLRG